MGKCLVTKFDATVDNSSLRKRREVRLKAVSAGDLIIRPYYDNVRVVCLSGQMSYEGVVVPYKDIAKDTSSLITLTCTTGTIVAIENKYGIDYLRSKLGGNGEPCFELTNGDTIESLYNIAFNYLALAGNTSGSIDGLDISKLAALVIDNCSNVEGSIDIFENSSVIRDIKVQNTKVSGNLHSLIGKDLSSTCHFRDSNIFVDVSEVASMSSGNTDLTKYKNCYLYGDMSSIDASVYQIQAQNKEKVRQFTWLTQRHTNPDAYIIGNYSTTNVAFIDYGTYLDDMLIDQAQCKVGAFKYIHVYGTHADNSGWENAVATLKTNGYTVTINGITQ